MKEIKEGDIKKSKKWCRGASTLKIAMNIENIYFCYIMSEMRF